MTDQQNESLIFVIDPNPNKLSGLLQQLKQNGFNPLVVETGESALQQIEEAMPDAVLLEVDLPGISGIEVQDRLKHSQKTKDIPVIFLSSESSADSKMTALEGGAADFISKPFQPGEVVARLNNHTATYKLQKCLRAEQIELDQESGRRKWVLEALQESRARYRFLAESSTDIIARHDFQGIYRYVSPACLTLLGFSIEEMVGRSILDFIHTADVPKVQSHFERDENDSLISKVTYRAQHKNGYYVWLETIVKVIQNPKTRLADELVTVSRDITDRKLAEEALREAHDKLEERVQERTAQLARLNLAYGRFVPHEFLKFLEKESIIDVNLGDQVQQEMTVLFSDIRSFTSLSEAMTPQENFNFINSYLGRVSPIIRQHNGFIDKYTGDGLMALFPETVEDALEAAVAMQQEVAAYNEYRRQRSHQPIQIGIGLHTGSLMLGTIGEAERMDTTVVSDAVNLASRMEGLTKIYGVSIIISDHSLFQLDQPTKYHFRFLDRVKVKGKQEAVAVFEIFNGDPENIIELKLRTRTNFEKGQLFYHSQEFAKAKTYFEQVLEESPVDIAAQLYLKRVSHFLTYGAPVDWEGIESLDEK